MLKYTQSTIRVFTNWQVRFLDAGMKMEIDALHYLLAETCKWGLGLVLGVSVFG